MRDAHHAQSIADFALLVQTAVREVKLFSVANFIRLVHTTQEGRTLRRAMALAMATSVAPAVAVANSYTSNNSNNRSGNNNNSSNNNNSGLSLAIAVVKRHHDILTTHARYGQNASPQLLDLQSLLRFLIAFSNVDSSSNSSNYCRQLST